MLRQLFQSKKATLDFVLGLILMIALVTATAMIGFKIFKFGTGGAGLKSLNKFAASIDEFSTAGQGSSSSVVLEIEEGDVVFGFSKYDAPLMKMYNPTVAGIGDSMTVLHKFIRKPTECESGLACICYCEGHSTHDELEATCSAMACKSIDGVNFQRITDQALLVPSDDYLWTGTSMDSHPLLNGFALYNRETLFPKVAFDPAPNALVNMRKPLGELTHIRIEKGKDDLVAICVYQEGRQCLSEEMEKSYNVAKKTQDAIKAIEQDITDNNYGQAVQRLNVLLSDRELLEQLDSYTAEKLYYLKGIAHLGTKEYGLAEESFEKSIDVAEIGMFTADAKAKLDDAVRLKECKELTCEQLSTSECETNTCGIPCIVMEKTVHEGEEPLTTTQKYCTTPSLDILT
ncbi:hypothetical protein HYS47_03540 [Candidatus Woesearchaeota archaeon]|nr:hypothetical protein [Candidatus Woesearchaeota archaeon]